MKPGIDQNQIGALSSASTPDHRVTATVKPATPSGSAVTIQIASNHVWRSARIDSQRATRPSPLGGA